MCARAASRGRDCAAHRGSSWRSCRVRARLPRPLRRRRRARSAPRRSQARHRSSTASAAQTSAEPAQPMAVTSAISGWPLAMAARRAPSVTMSLSPVSATTVAQALATRSRRFVGGSPPNSGANSAALSRTAVGPRAEQLTRESRARRRAVDEHRIEHPGHARRRRRRRARRRWRARRSASKVPRLTRSASAPATKVPISSARMVIDGTAPAASSMLAV